MFIQSQSYFSELKGQVGRIALLPCLLDRKVCCPWKHLICRRIDHRTLTFLRHKFAQFLEIIFGEFLFQCFEPSKAKATGDQRSFFRLQNHPSLHIVPVRPVLLIGYIVLSLGCQFIFIVNSFQALWWRFSASWTQIVFCGITLQNKTFDEFRAICRWLFPASAKSKGLCVNSR